MDPFLSCKKTNAMNWLKFSDNSTLQLIRKIEVYKLKKDCYSQQHTVGHRATVDMLDRNSNCDFRPWQQFALISDRSTLALNLNQQLYIIACSPLSDFPARTTH